MFSISRLAVRHANFQGLRNVQTTAALQTVKMRVIPSDVDLNESFEDKNKRIGRELSPHLTIYKPQLTSILSITHRMTGCALTGGIWALGLGALLLPHDINHYITMIEGLHLSNATLMATKFIVAYPFTFHLGNGVRHLLWDTGRFLKIKEVYTTGYAMVIFSVISALIIANL